MALDRGIARLEDCALERALLGEERPVVSQGKLVTHYTRYDTQLVLFFLRQRLAHRYGAAEQRTDYGPSHDEVCASINAKLDRMIERDRAAGLLDENGRRRDAPEPR
jgi:hypothetical protein